MTLIVVWPAGCKSLASCPAVEHLAEVVPLHFLRKLVMYRGISSWTLEEIRQQVAPLIVRAPQRLQVVPWEEE